MLKQTRASGDSLKSAVDADLGSLYRAISALKTSAECARFFEDLCTRSELSAMAERWEVARRVATGESYRKISEATGASTATVTRVAQWLRFGSGGYTLVLERLQRTRRKSA